MSFKLAIFDSDGVLVDSEDLIFAALRTTLEDLGISKLNFNADDIRGEGVPAIIRRIETMAGRRLPEDFERRYRARMQELFNRELRAIEGVATAIDELGIEVCAVSNGPREKIQQSLTLTGLADRFGSRVFSAHDIGHFKPEPDLYLHAAHEMGVEPKNCVVIEDSLVGVQAAKAAGMTVLGYAPDGSSPSLEAAGAQIFSRMDMLPKIVAAF